MTIGILDGVVIGIVLISALLAMFRGFVREVLSIAAWVAAAVLAYLFYPDLLPFVIEYVNNETVAVGLSAVAIFLVSLIVVSLITMKISDFVMDSPIGIIDRLLGFLFGAARGVLLMVVAAILFNYLLADQYQPSWVTNSATYPELTRLGEQLLNVIPAAPEEAIRDAFGEVTGTPSENTPSRVVEPANQGQLNQLLEGATQGPGGNQPAN